MQIQWKAFPPKPVRREDEGEANETSFDSVSTRLFLISTRDKVNFRSVVKRKTRWVWSGMWHPAGPQRQSSSSLSKVPSLCATGLVSFEGKPERVYLRAEIWPRVTLAWMIESLRRLPQVCGQAGWTISDFDSRLLISCFMWNLRTAMKTAKKKKKEIKKIFLILSVMFLTHTSGTFNQVDSGVLSDFCGTASFECFAASLMWSWLDLFGPLFRPLRLKPAHFI